MYCAGNERLIRWGRNEEKVEKDKREVGMFARCEVTRKKMKIKSWRREERVEGRGKTGKVG